MRGAKRGEMSLATGRALRGGNRWPLPAPGEEPAARFTENKYIYNKKKKGEGEKKDLPGTRAPLCRHRRAMRRVATPAVLETNLVPKKKNKKN